MENLDKHKKGPANSMWGGLIIVVVGLVFLLGNLNVALPHWLVKWHTIVLAIGLIIGFKHNFKGGGWLVMVLIGGLFTLESMTDFDFNFSKLTWPLILIGLGLFMILRPKNRCRKRFKRGFDNQGDPALQPTSKADYSDDFLDTVNVFGGSHQKVFSKNFKGGDILAIFGGCDVDLTQADFENTIVIDVTAIFGGCKIILPPTWEVKSEITAIFGGVDDKRNLMPSVDGASKRVVLKGIAMFGGVDIRNY